MAIGNGTFLGTGCIKHPKGWVPDDCGTCRFVVNNVVSYYRKREHRNQQRLERAS